MGWSLQTPIPVSGAGCSGEEKFRAGAFWTIIWRNPFISWEEPGEAVFSWPLCISSSEIVLNEPKVTPFTREATFSICTERHFQTVAWGQKASSVLGFQESPVSSLSAAWMYLFHSFAACSSGYTGKAMLGMIISGEVFVYFLNKKKLFCFYSTCLNGRTTNNLGSWRCVKRSITPSVAALFVIQVTDFCQERWQKNK